MTNFEYCKNICKGKCCQIYDKDKNLLTTCPNLSSDFYCLIYPNWIDDHCVFEFQADIGEKDLDGSSILSKIKAEEMTNVLKYDLMPGWIRSQCCYAHPELLT